MIRKAAGAASNRYNALGVQSPPRSVNRSKRKISLKLLFYIMCTYIHFIFRLFISQNIYEGWRACNDNYLYETESDGDNVFAILKIVRVDPVI